MTNRSAASGPGTSSSMFIAPVAAPPWAGPFRAPIAATMAEPRSLPVEQATRAVKVDALSPWSASRTR